MIRIIAMNKTICVTTLLIALISWTVHAQDATTSRTALPIGMTGGYETAQSKILKVYSVEDEGAQFRAYVVNWKGNEVIVSDALGTTNMKVGDEVTFMAMRIEIPEGDQKTKLLQFMILELPDFTMPTGPGKALEDGKQ
jgi:hypothetical protein